MKRYSEILPKGTRIFRRYEYIDSNNQQKFIQRQIEINESQLWSPESPQLYQLVLQAYTKEGLIVEKKQSVGLKEFIINGYENWNFNYKFSSRN